MIYPTSKPGPSTRVAPSGPCPVTRRHDPGAEAGPASISRYCETVNPTQAPLYEIKANLFRALAHPVRIRVLELLVASTGEVSVADLLADLAVSPSHLSGHLAVLKRHGVVESRRAGSHVYYRTAHPAVVDLLTAARTFLLDSLARGSDQLAAAEALPRIAPAS